MGSQGPPGPKGEPGEPGGAFMVSKIEFRQQLLPEHGKFNAQVTEHQRTSRLIQNDNKAKLRFRE